MQVIQVSAKADPDGVIRFAIPTGPAGAEYELAVVLTPKTVPNGPTRPQTPEEVRWPPGFLEATYGSITDEILVRPTQPLLEDRLPLG